MTERLTVDSISSDQLDRLYDERDQLRAAILDIDAHATPIGLADENDPDGNPHHYALTVGALHRALGKVGHTAPSCQAEDLLRIAHDTSNKSEAERALAAERADRVEATLREVLDAFEAYWARASYCGPDVSAVQPEHLHAWRATLTQPESATEATEPSRVLTVDPSAVTATSVEATRQMDADTTQPHTGLVVQPYREHGEEKWVFRCWGTAICDGWLSLDHYSQQSAERARDRHVTEDHSPTCTGYQVPATSEDSGLCASCGMADYKHRKA